ncbi:hypothetical protein M011DRAFT_409038 [Sporormia fimetaria CBS 119925]|uniref:Uncharacterized protein n=1 Tax=Sporormia fimetaria CBS 119925 TaxID=1340428 RepID=A0A6A6V132_9PLEO|nr:hypothetical protein M011DRAFT_409038 [Sporormia fimetaria CBS 119925]
MPPDLNSLPPSPSPSSPSLSRVATGSPALSQSPPVAHTPPHSLAAAAALNAGIQHEEFRRSSGSGVSSMRRDVDRARRRSSVRLNLNINDPSLPAPGEMQMSPPSRMTSWPASHHERAPSLGELHQELEAEQEGQVNRLLNMIRQQQSQILALQAANPNAGVTSAIDDSTPTSERSFSLPQSSQIPIPPLPMPTASSRSPYGTPMSRQSSIAGRSRTSSHHGSPALRPMPANNYESSELLPGSATSGRDESAYYQAETQTLTRENQMLKLRIRELERQLAELNPTSAITHSPVMSSGLHSSSSTPVEDAQASTSQS